MKKTISASDMILNKDGSIYHLNLRPQDIANTIITVGDPERVAKISSKFDKINFRMSNREFVTHTGELDGKQLTVLSTGIGTDNIDIVLNELDALVNVDFESRTVKANHTSLDIIRIGTTGGMQSDIETGSLVLTEFAIGLDGLLLFYDQHLDETELELDQAFRAYCDQNLKLPLNYYVTKADKSLLAYFPKDFTKGITITCPGFYAPQGRQVRALNPNKEFLDQISGFSFKNLRTTNFEMESAGIYGLGTILGHRCLSASVIIANRKKGLFSENPKKDVEKLIDTVFETIIAIKQGILK